MVGVMPSSARTESSVKAEPVLPAEMFCEAASRSRLHTAVRRAWKLQDTAMHRASIDKNAVRT
jgi:hypothetical protein